MSIMGLMNEPNIERVIQESVPGKQAVSYTHLTLPTMAVV